MEISKSAPYLLDIGIFHLDILLACREFKLTDSTKKPLLSERSYHGGPTDAFLKPSEVDELLTDLVLLHARLAELGVVYRNNEAYLEDLEGFNA
jgi:hypothetical protein